MVEPIDDDDLSEIEIGLGSNPLPIDHIVNHWALSAIIARLRRAEAVAATARRDALEEAAQTIAALPITAVKWDDSYEEGEWGKIDLFDHAIKETIAVASSAIRAMIEKP